MLKKIVYSIFCLFTFLLMSCSEDEEINFNETDLIGKWYQQSGNNPQCEKDYIEFKKNYVYKEIDFIMIPPIGNMGDWVCQPIDVVQALYGRSWKLTGNKIEFHDGYDTPEPPKTFITVKIITLTPDLLQLESSSGEISTYTAN